MKVPPYGKPLKALLEDGQLPDNSVYLYIGDKSWEKGKLSSYCRPTRTLSLPPNHLPFSYEWPVNGCDILMIETSHLSDEYIQDIVNTLFIHNAIKVTLISFDFSINIYKKDF